MNVEMDLMTTQDHIKHHGDMMREAAARHSKDGNPALAKRCTQRAEAAGRGKLLWGTQESTDPAHMAHQKLFNAAQKHGLLEHDFEEPGPN